MLQIIIWTSFGKQEESRGEEIDFPYHNLIL